MELQALREKSMQLRRDAVECIGHFGTGHIGGVLSVMDILTVLYYKEMRNIDPKDPKKEGRDRCVISKGHSGPAVYAVLADKGYFPKEWLKTLNLTGTNLPSHCDMVRTPGIDMTTGSLGQGFSCAVGVAVGGKIKKEDSCVYTIIGDGESQEGQIWEASMYAAHAKLDNLIAFLDRNKFQIDGAVDDINSLTCAAKKWEAFGWDTQEIDGHDMEQIIAAIAKAKTVKDKPHMIVCNTVKGKGVKFIEDAGALNHHMNISPEQTKTALAELA